MEVRLAQLGLRFVDVIVAFDYEDGDEVFVAVDYASVTQSGDTRTLASFTDHSFLDIEDHVFLAADHHQHSSVGVNALDVEVDVEIIEMEVHSHEEGELLLEVEVGVVGCDLVDFYVLGDCAGDHCACLAIYAAVCNLNGVLHPLIFVLEDFLVLEVRDRVAVHKDIGCFHVMSSNNNNVIVLAFVGIVSGCQHAMAKL